MFQCLGVSVGVLFFLSVLKKLCDSYTSYISSNIIRINVVILSKSLTIIRFYILAMLL